jgi:hypothetical protein
MLSSPVAVFAEASLLESWIIAYRLFSSRVQGIMARQQAKQSGGAEWTAPPV